MAGTGRVRKNVVGHGTAALGQQSVRKESQQLREVGYVGAYRPVAECAADLAIAMVPAMSEHWSAMRKSPECGRICLAAGAMPIALKIPSLAVHRLSTSPARLGWTPSFMLLSAVHEPGDSDRIAAPGSERFRDSCAIRIRCLAEWR